MSRKARNGGSCAHCVPRNCRGLDLTTLPAAGAIARQVLGFLGGKRAVVVRVRPHSEDLAYLAGLVVDARLKPVVSRELPLAEAAQAFAESRAGHAQGKIVLVV